MDDDIHFRNEERKKKTQGWVEGGGVEEKQAAAAAEERKGEKKCFAWLQSKRAEEGGCVFFRLRLAAAVTDGCVCV